MQYSVLLLSARVFNSTGVHGLLCAIQGAIGWRARAFIWVYCWGLFMRLLFNQVRGFVHAFVMIIMLLWIMKSGAWEFLIFTQFIDKKIKSNRYTASNISVSI